MKCSQFSHSILKEKYRHLLSDREHYSLNVRWQRFCPLEKCQPSLSMLFVGFNQIKNWFSSVMRTFSAEWSEIITWIVWFVESLWRRLTQVPLAATTPIWRHGQVKFRRWGVVGEKSDICSLFSSWNHINITVREIKLLFLRFFFQ